MAVVETCRRPNSTGRDAVTTMRAGPDFSVEPGTAGQRIGYRLAGTRVEIVYWPQLDNVDDERAVAYPLVDGVRGLRIAAQGAAPAWQTRWPIGGDSAVPRAVRVELELDDGTTVDRTVTLR